MTDTTKPTTVDIYRGLPLSLLEMLDRYLMAGIYPGSALGAVLRNDLRGAMQHGDEEFVAKLRLLVLYLNNRVPSAAWGSEEAVNWWAGTSTEARVPYLEQNSHGRYIQKRRRDLERGLDTL